MEKEFEFKQRLNDFYSRFSGFYEANQTTIEALSKELDIKQRDELGALLSEIKGDMVKLARW